MKYQFFSKWIAILVLTIWALVYLKNIYNRTETPLIGIDDWRNAQTFSVARNFIEEELNIFEPRYDIRDNRADGKFPGEFPLYNFATAGMLKIFGTKPEIARKTTFIIGCMLICLGAYVSYLFSKSYISCLIFAGLFITNVMMASLMISIMPETTCNFLAVAALLFFLKFENLWIRTLFTLLFVTLAVLVKPAAYAVVCFFIIYRWPKNLPELFSLLVIALFPVVILKIWINYTLQFEHMIYKSNYSITHHYLRKFEWIINELTWENLYFAWLKTYKYALNVTGLAVLLLLGISLAYKIIKTKNTSLVHTTWTTLLSIDDFLFDNIRLSKVHVALLAWIVGAFCFLLLAGDIQKIQEYYSAFIAIPFILLTTVVATNLRYLVIILLFVNIQLNIWKIRMDEWYPENEQIREYNRLEKITDKFSDRKDFFIVYPMHGPDFSALGRIGRKGMNVPQLSDLSINLHKADYVYVCDSTKLDIEFKKVITSEPVYHYMGNYFFKIK